MTIKRNIRLLLKSLSLKKTKVVRCNVDDARKLVFIHNPKCAGTSLRSALGFDVSDADHRYPDEYLSATEWEHYYTICVVREPISRLMSSYRFHCMSDYSGYYTKKYSDIKGWSFERYLSHVIGGDIIGMGAQRNFLIHSKSNVGLDCLLQFEKMNYVAIPECYYIHEVRPMNTLSQRKGELNTVEINSKDFNRLIDFYYEDYEYLTEMYALPSRKDTLKYGLCVR